MRRKNRIDRIESRIEWLRERATELFDREQAAIRELEALHADHPSAGRVRAVRAARAIKRRARRAEGLRDRRAELVAVEVRAIMLALEGESRRTRERLDRELERLEPIHKEWDRLRAAFDSLDGTVEVPALAEHAGSWHGELGIPEFPVHEHEGYVKPFPPQAVLF